MAGSFSEPQPLNAVPPFIPPDEISDCFNPEDPCDGCPGPRVAMTWNAGGSYGFEPDEDIKDGLHSIWVGGIAQWIWTTGGEFLARAPE